MKYLKIKGIKVHNLKGIDVRIPLGKITVITGLSGSGKSSLLFDTIYSESSRRFIESLGTYSRRYMMKLPAPDVESVENIPPAISIRYRPLSVSSRSTVGTSTEIYDYIRLLYAKVSDIWCPECEKKVETVSPTEAAGHLLEKHKGAGCIITFKVTYVADEMEQTIKNLLAKGFYRIYEKGNVVDLNLLNSNADMLRELFVIVDRVRITAANRVRISEAVETAYREAGGGGQLHLPENDKAFTMTEIPVCVECGSQFEKPVPATFSFNNPLWACQRCRGFGDLISYDKAKVIPDGSISIRDGAVKPLEFNRFRYFRYAFLRDAEEHGISLDTSWNDLTEEQRELAWEGKDDFEGINELFRIMERKRYRVDYRAMIARFRVYSECHECGGSRLRKEAMNYKVFGATIHDLVRMPVSWLSLFIQGVEDNGNRAIRDIIFQINERAANLIKLGVGYLSLERMTKTLSGGELQRINLINAAGARLTGTLYLLDEPSIGLHPADEKGLKEVIRNLKQQGNTVIIAEHSHSIINMADYVIELGPYAGESGGEVVFSGSLNRYKNSGRTITARYLTGALESDIPDFRRQDTGKKLEIVNASKHNLKNVNVTIPLGGFVCVTGPSGAGKSTLIIDTLYQYWRSMIQNEPDAISSDCEEVRGLKGLKEMIFIKGGKIARSPRSCVATYSGIFTEVRNIYADMRLARIAGMEAKDFSFNTAAGRCPECRGRGEIIVDMQFLPQVTVTCERCNGTRYRDAPLKFRYKGYSISGLLNKTAGEAMEIFKDRDRIIRKLRLLRDLNLDYLRLGQPLNTLSSGEAARLKLAGMIVKGEIQDRLYLFDEPSLGLHPHNIMKLIKVFTRLLVNGASIICIDHNIDIIKSADYIIDMGQGGGENGGSIVAAGTPEEICVNKNSITGRYLKFLQDRKKEEKKSPIPFTKSL